MEGRSAPLKSFLLQSINRRATEIQTRLILAKSIQLVGKMHTEGNIHGHLNIQTIYVDPKNGDVTVLLTHFLITT